MPPTRIRRTSTTKEAPQARRRITVSERLSRTPVRYFKRGGKTLARCRHCGTLVRGGMRAMAKHAGTCKEFHEDTSLYVATPIEVIDEVTRLNRALTACRKRLRQDC